MIATMSHPERRGGAIVKPWIELHSDQVCDALSLTYRKLEYWTDQGLVEVESYRQGSRVPFRGSGAYRLYRYNDILQLGLVRELRNYIRSLKHIRDILSWPPDNVASWGELISCYDPAKAGDIFYACHTRSVGETGTLDLINTQEEFSGIAAVSLSSFFVNLGMLKDETDKSIEEVLSRP